MGNVSGTLVQAGHATQDLGVECIQDPGVAHTQGQEEVLTPDLGVVSILDLGVENIRALAGGSTLAREAEPIPARVVVRIQGQEVVHTQVPVDRAIQGLTMAKLIDGIDHHHTVSKLRFSRYFQHSITVVH